MESGQEDLTASHIDMHTPSATRIYDYLLGGVENYASDRAAGNHLMRVAPGAELLARNNRAFVGRAVRVLVREFGIRQFLDHGSGLPTRDNVHEVAQRAHPRCKVAYIDNDPMVVAHAQTTLHENAGTSVISQDLRNTDEIRTATEDFLDWEQPIASLFTSVLHCLPDTDDVTKSPAAVVRRAAGQLPRGSFLVISQLASDDPDVRRDVTELMGAATRGRWGRVRETREVRGYFDELDVLEPGLGDVADWRPRASRRIPRRRPQVWAEWGGVGRVCSR
ncbi:SAM-dependent methyltransferase [Streptomyces sp. NPDC059443]